MLPGDACSGGYAIKCGGSGEVELLTPDGSTTKVRESEDAAKPLMKPELPLWLEDRWSKSSSDPTLLDLAQDARCVDRCTIPFDFSCASPRVLKL